MTKSRRNQGGQIAIFVALIFQVLFVLFAMALNVALVVHDKINLQNSADLAAYYGAMKQAEILNAIAHQNYQIRQAWKLLTWRYRFLGTFGQDSHPLRVGANAEVLWPSGTFPTLCMTYKPTWIEAPPDENLCRARVTSIPEIPIAQVIAPFFGLNQAFRATSVDYRNRFDKQCENHGALNWFMAASFMQAYRNEQKNRLAVIEALANNLSDGTADFFDLDGGSVRAGADKTFKKNLTYAQRVEGAPSIVIYNSMQGIEFKKWLPKIFIYPQIFYTDVTNASGCQGAPQHLTTLPARSSAQNFLRGELNAQALIDLFRGDVSPESPEAFTLGVEKNPWYQVYFGVRVTSRPRQIFFPFGPRIPMTAKSFAKPFGGRIGPWYGKAWPANAPNSSGSEVDPLLPPRVNDQGDLAPNLKQDTRNLPNYSRFPGDSLGFNSQLAQRIFLNFPSISVAFHHYQEVWSSIAPGLPNDTLAFDFSANQESPIRQFETAVVAPDLFDITYYSVEPNWSENYLKRIEAARDNLGIPRNIVLRADLGQNTVKPELSRFSVELQMGQARERNLYNPEVSWVVRDKAHLLTGWIPNTAFVTAGDDASGIAEAFGACTTSDEKFKFKNPGSCVVGGRVGYSVKMVNPDYLLQAVPGDKTNKGPLQNPPPADF